MNQEQEDAVETWLGRFIDYLSGEVLDAPHLDELDSADRPEARRQAHAVSELWGRNAGRIGQPSTVGVALGLHSLDQPVAIDGQKLKSRRQLAGLKASALAVELRRLGWPVSAAEIVEIESGKRPDIPGTAFPLLVASLNVGASDLVDVEAHPIDRLLATRSVRNRIEAASRRLGKTIEDIVSVLRPQLAGAHFREHDSQEDDILEIIDALLDRME